MSQSHLNGNHGPAGEIAQLHVKMGYKVEHENVLMILVLMVRNAQENLHKPKFVQNDVVHVSFHYKSSNVFLCYDYDVHLYIREGLIAIF